MRMDKKINHDSGPEGTKPVSHELEPLEAVTLEQIAEEGLELDPYPQPANLRFIMVIC